MNEIPKIKIVFVGASSVGKTSIISYYVNHFFDAQANPTIGVGNYEYETTIHDMQVHLSIWDTAGQEKYQGLAPMYYRQANFIVLTVDCTRENTLDYVKREISSIKLICGEKITFGIALNKIDLNISESLREAVEEFAQKEHIEVVVQTSALLGCGIDILFDHGVDLVLHTPVERSKTKPKDIDLTNTSTRNTCC